MRNRAHNEFGKFDVGDRVRHLNLGLGTVTAIKDSCVCVTYDELGEKAHGKYDRQWFDLHAGFLTWLSK
jgi:hypothetical protein